MADDELIEGVNARVCMWPEGCAGKVLHPLEDLVRHHHARLGRRQMCYQCDAERAARYYEANAEAVRASERRRYAARKRRADA